MTVQALLFDLDGTLVDTEVELYGAWVELVAREGHDFRGMPYADVIGRPDLDCARIVIGRFGLRREPEEFYAEYRDLLATRVRKGVALRPGVLHALDAGDRLGVPMAVVTSSMRRHLVQVLGRHGLGSRFRAAVTADTPGLTARKPDPAPYLLAAELLGVDPRRCVAFEDSPTGVASALAAGCYVCGVPHQHSVQSGLSQAHRILHDLSCFDPARVEFDRMF